MAVEGGTEEAFVQAVLAPHLAGFGVLTTATSLGGRVSVDRLATEMARLTHSFNVVTTMVDFYGFRKPPGHTPDSLQERIDSALSAKSPRTGTQVFSYVQMYEFEALLFADPAAFAVLADAPSAVPAELRKIRRQFPTPEDINDARDTAPHRRIEDHHPRYRKVQDGRAVAEQIGLDRIRAECPRFDAWVGRLENLNTQGQK